MWILRMHVYCKAYDSYHKCLQKSFSEAQWMTETYILKEFFVLPNFKFPIIVVAVVLWMPSAITYTLEQQVIESKSHGSFGQDFQKNNKRNIPFISWCWYMIYDLMLKQIVYWLYLCHAPFVKIRGVHDYHLVISPK